MEGAETEAEPEVETDVLLYFRLVVQTEAFSQVVTAAEANGEDGYCCAVVVAVVATVAELVGADEVEGNIAEVDVAEVADRVAERPSAAEPEAQLEEYKVGDTQPQVGRDYTLVAAEAEGVEQQEGRDNGQLVAELPVEPAFVAVASVDPLAPHNHSSHIKRSVLA